MNSAVSVNTKGIKFVAVLAALATCCLAVMAFGANSAKASTPGAPINFSFNYVGLTIGTTVAGDIDSLVLTPSTEAGTPPALLGPLSVTGTYDDASGNFTVQDAGFDFPPIGVDIDVATIDGTIGLAEAAHGNYNAATGAMTFNPKIKLTLGTSDIAALPDPIGGFGSGPLSCEFSPLDLSLSSTGTWPHAASNFAQPGAITNGSISGAFTKLPKVKTLAGGPTLCPLVAGILQPVGGLWLANSDAIPELSTMPAATGPKPAPYVDPVCEAPKVGTYPACTDPVVVVDKTPASIKGSSVAKKVKIKKGKKGTIKVVVKNSGESDATGVSVCIKVSKKFAQVPKCSKSTTVAGGASKTVKLKVKLGKKAKGTKKATITIKSSAGKVVKKVKITAKK